MRVRLPQSGADAKVSTSVSPETLEALDEMMLAVRNTFEIEAPKPKPCGDRKCQHSRRQHLHKRKHARDRGVDFNYGACRVSGCRCLVYHTNGNAI